MHKKDVIIHKIFTSPAHNYFTNKKYHVGNTPTILHDNIELFERKGLQNDRFEFSKYPITLFSLEVAEEVCSSLNIPLNLELFRRNIIISGVHLNSLIGQKFKIGDIELEGIAHCSPCTWMNAVMGKGAYALMKGRGGLRVKVLSGGVLTTGESLLESKIILQKDPLEANKIVKIPT